MADTGIENGNEGVVRADQVNQGDVLETPSPATGEKGGQNEGNATGKFEGKTAAEVQRSFEELESRFGQQGNELSTLRTQIEELNGKLSGQQQSATPETGNKADVGFDLESSLNELQKEYEEGNINAAELQRRTVALTRESVNADTQKLLGEATRNIEQNVANQFAQRELEKKRASFLKDNPDFSEMQKSGALAKFVQDDPYGFHDEFSAYHALKAEQAKQQGIEEGKKIKAGAETGPPVLDGQGPSDSEGGGTLESMIAAALSAGE